MSKTLHGRGFVASFQPAVAGVAAALSFFVHTLCPAVASAAPADAPVSDAGSTAAATPSRDAPAQAVLLDGYLGLGQRLERERWDTTMHVGVTGLYRIDWVTFGVGGELGAAIFEDESQRLAALGGATLQVTSFMHLAALAEVGVHFERPVEGLDIFGSSEIIGHESTAVPYAGVRLNPLFRLGGRNRNHFLIGPTFLARKDLAETSGAYTEQYCSDGWFGDTTSCSTSRKENAVGGLHLAAAVMIGAEFGR